MGWATYIFLPWKLEAFLFFAIALLNVLIYKHLTYLIIGLSQVKAYSVKFLLYTYCVCSHATNLYRDTEI